MVGPEKIGFGAWVVSAPAAWRRRSARAARAGPEPSSPTGGAKLVTAEDAEERWDLKLARVDEGADLVVLLGALVVRKRRRRVENVPLAK